MNDFYKELGTYKPKDYPGPWKQLGEGGYMVLGNPEDCKWTWKALAEGLAKINRYDGSTHYPFSIAQHSCIVHDNAAPIDRFHGLMHDAPEWIIGDENAPRKHHFKQELCRIGTELLKKLPQDRGIEVQVDRYLTEIAQIIPDLEGKVFEIFYDRAGRSLPDFEARKRIKALDLRALVTEQRDLMSPNPTQWPWVTGHKPFKQVIKPWPWTKAADEFLKRLQYYTEVKR